MSSSTSSKLGRALALGVLGCATLGAPAVKAQQAAYVGEIMFVAFSPCPFGWAEANGQMLPVASNQALFSVIGTTYGGDETTFALPNVQGVVSYQPWEVLTDARLLMPRLCGQALSVRS